MNVLIFKGQIVKLAEFGCARKINSDSLLTRGVGDWIYKAPESKIDDHVPFKSDMYSLGLTLHKMVTK